MEDLQINRERLQQALHEVNAVAVTEQGGVNRQALTDADRAARDLLVLWMQEVELEVRVDDLGTIYGRRRGAETGPPVVLGSHLDSVPNGGRFDGALGVVAALEVMRVAHERRIQTRLPLVLVDFTNEEGARFEPAMMASGVLAGRFTRDYVYARTDSTGRTFGDELARIGYVGAEGNRLTEASAYLELHVEQGPVLDVENCPVGIVEGIQGISWMQATFTGEADHAGPTPMGFRRDALTAAARLITGVQAMARKMGDPAVATVGRIEVEPGIINVIPGSATLGVDVRHPQGEGLETLKAGVEELSREVAAAEGVAIHFEHLWTSPPTPFDREVIELLEEVARELGLKYRRMVSGAGHDAKYVAEFAPAAMIFVRSRDGVSHSPKEHSEWDEIHQAAQLLLHGALRLTQ